MAVRRSWGKAVLGQGGPRARRSWGKASVWLDSSPLDPVWSALFHSTLPCIGLLCSTPTRCLQCFSSSRGNMVFSLWWRGKMRSIATEGLTYIDRSPRLWSLIGQMKISHLHSLVPKALIWLFRMELLWLASEDSDGDIAMQLWLDGESLHPIHWNRIPGAPF